MLLDEKDLLVLENLEYGSYTIIETQVPVGYVGDSEKTVTLSSENLDDTVTLTNEKNKVVNFILYINVSCDG